MRGWRWWTVGGILLACGLLIRSNYSLRRGPWMPGWAVVLTVSVAILAAGTLLAWRGHRTGGA